MKSKCQSQNNAHRYVREKRAREMWSIVWHIAKLKTVVENMNFSKLAKIHKMLVFWESNYHFHSFLSCVHWTKQLATVHIYEFFWKKQEKERNDEVENTHTHTNANCIFKYMQSKSVLRMRNTHTRPSGHGAPQWWNKSIKTTTRLLPIGKNARKTKRKKKSYNKPLAKRTL